MTEVKVDLNDILSRLKIIIANPKNAWAQISVEKFSVAQLYKRYLFVMVAIPVVCSFIGMTLFGIGGFYRPPFFQSLVGSVVQYIVGLAIAYIAAFVISKVAGMLDASPSIDDSLKLVTFAAFPAYAAGVFSIYPLLSVIGSLFALYSVYVFYTGVTPVLGVTEEKRIKLCLLSFIGVLVAGIVLGAISAIFQPSATSVEDILKNNQVNIEGVDTEELQKGLQMLEKAVQNQQNN